jgi:dipeptidase E
MRILLLSNSKNPGMSLLAHAEAEIRGFLGGGVKTVLFVPFAGVVETWDNYASAVREAFGRMGYELASLHDAGDPVAAVERAEALYVGGGNTFYLLRALYDTRTLQVIARRVREGTPYVGASAGTNVACPTIKTTNDMPIVEPPSLEALGLVPFQINPHYTDESLAGHAGESREQRIAEFRRVNPGTHVVGLREGSMLRIEDSSIKLVGDKAARVFASGREPVECGPEDSLQFLPG